MQSGDYLVVFIILFVILLLFVWLVFAFLHTKTSKKQTIIKDYSAHEILELVKDSNNSLSALEEYSKIAKAHYHRYMGEISDFDLEFVVVLSAHKHVNAKLILEVERYFKVENPNRATLLDNALGAGLKKR